MTEANENTPKRNGFGGIFSGITNMIMTDAYLAQMHADDEKKEKVPEEVAKTEPVKPVATYVAPVIAAPVVVQQSSTDVEAMIAKIIAAFEAMNQPGIDFLEIWNAAETMGGINEQNLTAAYKILNIGAGNTLTTPGIVDSGNYYVSGLRNQIESGIEQKKAEREKLVKQQRQENESLVNEVNGLVTEIDRLGKELLEKRQKLSVLDSTYVKPLSDIDQKINVGSAALGQVINKLQNAINILGQIKI
jgi:hypothetical protein